MSRYRIEWQLGGESIIDTDDWTEEEVSIEAHNELGSLADDVTDKLIDALDANPAYCQGDGTARITVARLP